MIYYESQGKRIAKEPIEAVQNLLKSLPPNAELIVWEENDIIEICTVEDKLNEITP